MRPNPRWLQTARRVYEAFRTTAHAAVASVHPPAELQVDPERLRVLFAGPRTLTEQHVVAHAFTASGFRPSVLLSDGERGASALAEAWARARGIPIERHQSPWHYVGQGADAMRHAAALARTEALVAVWNGEDALIGGLIRQAYAAGVRVYVQRYDARR